MADKEIDDLTAGTDPKTSLFHGVEGANSRKYTGAVIGHQLRGARVRMSSDDTAQNATAGLNISFDVADFDTDTFWSAGTPARLTIPAGLGITHVELAGQVSYSSATGDTFHYVSIAHLNSGGTGLRLIGQRAVERGGTSGSLNAFTGPVAVTAGDYFQLLYQEESDTSVTIEGDSVVETFLAILVIGMEPV